jgi:hypothetical protein
MSSDIPNVPKTIKPLFLEILDIIRSFCDEKLNEEYYELSMALAAKLARKRPSPITAGRKSTWAAGIVHAVGMVNFVFDRSQTPSITSKEMCEWFGLGQSTISGKSKIIRDMFKMRQLDPKWCLPSRLEDNPMAWMISINGFIMDARTAPHEIQMAAFEAGAIPYIPEKCD